MSKKRPRDSQGGTPALSKLEPDYWRARLFKNTYTYKGRRSEVNNWSVKIQHSGKRRTFSLASGDVGLAAAEACELYRAILKQGWRGHRAGLPWKPALLVSAAERLRADYWAERLIRRENTMKSSSDDDGELSIRIEHEGVNHYFPLGTSDPALGAERALQIYRVVASQGWSAASRRFRRELTVAFRWLDNPLAWTYTTIHTQVGATHEPSTEQRQESDLRVAVVESDPGIRRALAWCLGEMQGFSCSGAFADEGHARKKLQRQASQLVLINRNLGGRPGVAFRQELKVVLPRTAALLYSVYEDSEELFGTTPGGAPIYVLQRTRPEGFLEPLAGVRPGSLTDEELAASAWKYFKDIVAALPIGSQALRLGDLTEREHQILVLLSRGYPDKEIADQLGISIYTAREHLRNIFEKLGVHNRTEAVVKYLQK